MAKIRSVRLNKMFCGHLVCENDLVVVVGLRALRDVKMLIESSFKWNVCIKLFKMYGLSNCDGIASTITLCFGTVFWIQL